MDEPSSLQRLFDELAVLMKDYPDHLRELLSIRDEFRRKTTMDSITWFVFCEGVAHASKAVRGKDQMVEQYFRDVFMSLGEEHDEIMANLKAGIAAEFSDSHSEHYESSASPPRH